MRQQATYAVLIALNGLWPLSCATSSSTSRDTGASSAIQSSTETGAITTEMIGRRYGTMAIPTVATDKRYGYSEKLPIPIGGGFGEGGHNVNRYLNSLLGPAGEPVHYKRLGTCCEFKTARSPFGDTALLEVYEVHYEGGQTPVRLYFNWYESGSVVAPAGFTAADK